MIDELRNETGQDEVVLPVDVCWKGTALVLNTYPHTYQGFSIYFSWTLGRRKN